MKKIKIIGMGIIFSILLSGCQPATVNNTSTPTEIKNTSTTQNTPAVQNTPTETQITQSNAVEEDYKKVFANAKELKIKAQLEDGRPWFAQAITDEGEIIGTTSSMKKPAEIFIYNIKTGKTETIYTLKGKFGANDIKENENYMIWTEYIDMYSDRESRVVFYDKKTKKTKVLEENLKKPASIPDERTALGKDYVLLGIATPDGDKNRYVIEKYDIEKDKTSILKEDAAVPAIGEDFIAYFAPDDNKQTSAIFVQNLKDNTVKKITQGKNPVHLIACGNSIVFSGYENMDCLSKDKAKQAEALLGINLYVDGKILNIQTNINDHYDFPNMSDNFVSWTGTDKLRCYDRKSNKIAILSSDQNAACADPIVSNKYILWNSPVIQDENQAKQAAMKDGIYLSYLHILSLQ